MQHSQRTVLTARPTFVWFFAVGEDFHEHYAKRPDIGSRAVFVVGQDFWCHPFDCHLQTCNTKITCEQSFLLFFFLFFLPSLILEVEFRTCAWLMKKTSCHELSFKTTITTTTEFTFSYTFWKISWLTPFGLQCLSVAIVPAWGCLEKLVNKQGSHTLRSFVCLFVNGLWWNFVCWQYTV